MAHKITIYHMYPESMNLYGDLGNIVTLVRRCEWRGIEVNVVNVKVGDKVDFSACDILFMGGGQDSGQKIVTEDLVAKGPAIKSEVEGGMPALVVCGGFQLFGHYFETVSGDKIPGISVFDAYTVAGNKRLIGNVVVDIAHALTEWESQFNIQLRETGYTTLVGFENHSGQTILEGETQPLGYVIRGFGNKGDGGYEGAVYKNAFGTYLHGSVLPKNPWFADHLIMCALYRRYGNVEALKPLDDKIEVAAHDAAIERSKTAKTLSI
jgi:lipid II isoglutaminyl synthase (glutamine-hydrolysing)